MKRVQTLKYTQHEITHCCLIFSSKTKGRHHQKIKVLIRALPELAKPPLNSGTLVLFSGRQNRRFGRMMEKNTDDDNNRCHDNFDQNFCNFDDNDNKN